MIIMYDTNHDGPVRFGSVTFFSVILGDVIHLRFFPYIFLLKPDRATGMVSLCSACQELLIDIHIEFLRSLFALKGT